MVAFAATPGDKFCALRQTRQKSHAVRPRRSRAPSMAYGRRENPGRETRRLSAIPVAKPPTYSVFFPGAVFAEFCVGRCFGYEVKGRSFCRAINNNRHYRLTAQSLVLFGGKQVVDFSGRAFGVHGRGPHRLPIRLKPRIAIRTLIEGG